MNKNILVLMCIFFVGVSSVAYYHYSASSVTLQPNQSTVVVGQATIVVDVATTPALRQQGLSGKQSLAWGSGMLFIFPQAGEWGFWMKDMRFAIDIIWADKAGIITTVLPNVSPTTYPQAFHPSAPSVYVLEVPAGYAMAQGIGVGQKIVVQYRERVE